MIKASFVELNGRERAQALCDKDTFKELLDPFDGYESPHLEKQGIVPQSDDGVIIARGTISGEESLIISIEGEFQGGGIGEVSGAKIAGSLNQVLIECENNNLIKPIILFDTGGVRLQEANYGLLSIAEIHAMIVALREYVPVTAIIPGKIGAYGGMSIAVGLCNSIIMTQEGRLSLNGPEVIETEAGIEEFDSQDRLLIWKVSGGSHRVNMGYADTLVKDDIAEIRSATSNAINKKSQTVRSEEINRHLEILNAFNPTEKLTSKFSEDLFNQKLSKTPNKETINKCTTGRGVTWFNTLTNQTESISDISTVRVANSNFLGEETLVISIVPDDENSFPRAREGEVGLREGWTIAKHVMNVVELDKDTATKRPIIAVVDVPSQAYGYNEELLGIYQSLAAAVNAYATARLAGHPVISYIPGLAISGAFLAHGMQSNRIIALRDVGVNVHVMSKSSAALITQRTIDDLDKVTKNIPAMAYDINSFEQLGALSALIEDVNADIPSEADKEKIIEELKKSVEEIRASKDTSLETRLTSRIALQSGRKATNEVRKALAKQW